MSDTTKVRVKFRDGLEKIQSIPVNKNCEGTVYLPHEFLTGRPDRVENVTVRSNPYQAQNSKYPLYLEVDPAPGATGLEGNDE